MFGTNGVKMHYKNFFWAKILYFPLLKQLKPKFYQLERNDVFDFSWGILNDQIAK